MKGGGTPVSGQASPSGQLDKRLIELSALFEISRSLNASWNLHAILENVLRISMGYMLISRGLVLLKDPDGGDFSVEALKGFSKELKGKSLRIDSDIGDTTPLGKIDRGPAWVEFFREFKIELLLPLNSNQGMIGLIGLGGKINGESYEETEIEFLDSIANIAATTVSNGMMVEEIQAVNRRLDRKLQQLNTIFDISREINSTLDPGKIGSLLTFAVMGELLVNRCAVFLYEEKRVRILVVKGVDRDISIGQEFCEVSQPVILEDTDRFQPLLSAGFALLVPMRIQDQTRGCLAVGPKITGESFQEADLEFLTSLGHQAMTSLENARLFQEMLEKQRMEEELHLARNIQKSLLPSCIPSVPGYDISALNIPSREVGGDYYDVIKLSDHEWGIAIGDVVGKGAGAALLMASLQASLRAISGEFDVQKIMERINNLIHKNTDMDKYITFFYGVLDTRPNRFTYSNAGHNYPFLIRPDGKTECLTEGGIVLGMMPDMVYQTGCVSLNAGDRIVLYTDGVTEAKNKDDVEFGEDRLKDLVIRNAALSSDPLIESIVYGVNAFSSDLDQRDDITLVVLKRLSRAPG
ncbi:SpoIIE family protein phosphatase [bacterium]|nr:SpoIIE family protein phosphatase [bacterium]